MNKKLQKLLVIIMLVIMLGSSLAGVLLYIFD